MYTSVVEVCQGCVSRCVKDLHECRRGVSRASRAGSTRLPTLPGHNFYLRVHMSQLDIGLI